MGRIRKIGSAHCNYSQILYQFLTFTQNLKRSLIFERFYRTDRSRNRKTGGAGIGLTIVKAIVLAHGGNISVESVKGCGSCFMVVLPKK